MMRRLIDTYVVYLHNTCLFTIQQIENNKKSYIKNEVCKYMISKFVNYNLNKKLQIYLVGQPWDLELTQNFFRNYSLSPGVWQSFVTIRACNHLMRIISTYVDNHVLQN